jgi:hypothetical protein
MPVRAKERKFSHLVIGMEIAVIGMVKEVLMK